MMKLRFAFMLIIAVFCASIKTDAHDEHDNPTPLLNPLRESHDFKALRPFSSELQALVDKLTEEGSITEAAVYFRSFYDGVWVGINEKNRFAPASLIKVPLMMVYLKEAEQNPEILKKKLRVGKTGHYNQHIPSKVLLKKGSEYTVDELIDIMIEDSNNDAMKILADNANADIGVKMYRQLGYTNTFSDEGDFLSLKAYVGTFRVLYNATFLNEKMSQRALNYLVQADFDAGLAAGVPNNVQVANKFGEYVDRKTKVKQLHDVGIVYYPENPYLIGIMTRGGDFQKLEHAIKEISSFIYHEVDRQYKRQNGPDFLYDFESED